MGHFTNRAIIRRFFCNGGFEYYEWIDINTFGGISITCDIPGQCAVHDSKCGIKYIFITNFLEYAAFFD